MEHDLTLAAYGIRLDPLALAHAPALLELTDESLWAGMTTATPTSVEDVEEWVREALETPQRLAFAVVDDDTGTVRGSTSFYDLALGQQRVEIGSTFYGRRWWGGTTNPACKLALLTHAFDVWQLYRVALRADARNARSIAAMLKLGAVPEGVLRAHRVAADGSRGDSAYFSILAPGWPAVREGLLRRLESPPAEASSQSS
ncbi:MAG: acetyltransferase [Actinotalea sp.]|nr:acetyltransferase [Actinotalea sp.]